MIHRVLPLAFVVAVAIGPINGAATARVAELRAQAGQPGVDQAPPAFTAPPMNLYPVKVRLMTLTHHLWTLGGLYVWIPDVRVDEVFSAQVFTIEPSHRLDRDRRALVVMGQPGAALERDAAIEVTGLTYTGGSARVGSRIPPGVVPQRIAEQFEHGPVIVADGVWMIGSVPVYSREDATGIAPRR
jgi:hypothetical protein